jgi:hypothetical protein
MVLEGFCSRAWQPCDGWSSGSTYTSFSFVVNIIERREKGMHRRLRAIRDSAGGRRRCGFATRN